MRPLITFIFHFLMMIIMGNVMAFNQYLDPSIVETLPSSIPQEVIDQLPASADIEENVEYPVGQITDSNGNVFDAEKIILINENGNRSLKAINVKSTSDGNILEADYLIFTGTGDSVSSGSNINVSLANGDKMSAESVGISSDEKATVSNFSTQRNGNEIQVGSLTLDSDGDVNSLNNITVKYKNGDTTRADAITVQNDRTMVASGFSGTNQNVTVSANSVVLSEDGDIQSGSGLDLSFANGDQATAQGLTVSDNQITTTSVSGATSEASFSADSLVFGRDLNIESVSNVAIEGSGGTQATAGNITQSNNGQNIIVSDVTVTTGNGETFSADGVTTNDMGNTATGTNVNLVLGSGDSISAEQVSVDSEQNISATNITGDNGDAVVTGSAVDVSSNGAVTGQNIELSFSNGDSIQAENVSGQYIDGEYEGVAQDVSTQSGGVEVNVGTLSFSSNSAVPVEGRSAYDASSGSGQDVVQANDISINGGEITGTAEALTLGQNGNINTLSGANIELSNGTITTQAQAVQYFDNGVYQQANAQNLGFSNRSSLNGQFDQLEVGHDQVSDAWSISTYGSANHNNIPSNIEFGANVHQLSNVSIVENENGGSINIQTTDDGGIEEMYVRLGDTISFEATDANGDATQLLTSFYYDEDNGKFFVHTVLKNGDQVEVKLMPFKFTSEQVAGDARLQLSASLNEENMGDYLATVTGLLDFNYINDYLSVGNGKLKVRVGGTSSGVEFFYSNPGLSLTESDNASLNNEQLTLGAGIFNRNQNGQTNSMGVLVSSVSSLSYDIQYGTLSLGGVPLPSSGQLPLTVGAYFQSVDSDGNAVFATLSTSLADTSTVAGVAGIRNRVGENSTLDLGFGVSTNGNYGVSAMFNHEISRTRAGVSDADRRNYELMSEEERRDIIFTPIREVRENAAQNQ